jgi:hypothetical protein
MSWFTELIKKDNHQDKNSSYLDKEITSSSPKYAIASTCYILEETIVFEADEHGNRISPDDYGCIAKRLGHIKMWANRDIAIQDRLRDNRYGKVKDFEEVDGCIQTLYERFDPNSTTPEELAQSMDLRYKDFFVC